MKKVSLLSLFFFLWTSNIFSQNLVNSEDVKGPVKQMKVTVEVASPSAHISSYGGPGLNNIEIITHYDTQGRLIKREHFHGGELADGLVRVYAKGVCRENDYDADGKKEGDFRIILLDSIGHEISMRCYRNGKFFARDSTVYDSFGRIIETYENISRKNDSLVLRYTIEYDSLGRVILRRDWRNGSRTITEYFTNGNYTKLYEGKDGTKHSENCTVDAEGRLIKLDGEGIRAFLSQYDQYGNWLYLKGETNTNSPLGWVTSITKREIEYYSDNEIAPQQIETDTVYLSSEQLPEFPGGQKAMFQYIADNVVYPLAAREKGIQGRSVCQFVVNKSGLLSDIMVVKSSGNEELDTEAVRVIASMPKWQPGRSADEVVRVKYTVPVSFKIAAPNPAKDSLNILIGDSIVRTLVDEMPEFPGGKQALFNYLAENIKYPRKAILVQGRVIVEFVVEQDGSISNVTIAKSSGNKWLDAEGIRLIKSMPKWKPGRLKGKMVRVKYCVPINFRHD